MQPIAFNVQTSSFAPRIEEAVRASTDLSIEPGGYNRDAVIEIRADDRHHFLTRLERQRPVALLRATSSGGYSPA
jgi:hypothetical protein